ncbi:MAG: 50S ribosomal protein L32e [Thermoproteota archaeon]
MKSDINRLLRVRKKQKARKPEFLRSLWWKFPKFKNDPKWRRPKGIDNPMRLKLKGYPPLAEIGYGSPSAVRGLHPTGLIPVIVSSPKEVEKLDPKKHIIYISSRVGLRKRIEILRAAERIGIKVAN